MVHKKIFILDYDPEIGELINSKHIFIPLWVINKNMLFEDINIIVEPVIPSGVWIDSELSIHVYTDISKDFLMNVWREEDYFRLTISDTKIEIKNKVGEHAEDYQTDKMTEKYLKKLEIEVPLDKVRMGKCGSIQTIEIEMSGIPICDVNNPMNIIKYGKVYVHLSIQ
jgi:hypothetical protein